MGRQAQDISYQNSLNRDQENKPSPCLRSGGFVLGPIPLEKHPRHTGQMVSFEKTG